MKLTKSEYTILTKHLETIRTILVNHSCSYISPEFKSDVKAIADAHKFTYCDTCNSGLLNLCFTLYAAYTEYKKSQAKTDNKNIKKKEQ